MSRDKFVCSIKKMVSRYPAKNIFLLFLIITLIVVPLGGCKKEKKAEREKTVNIKVWKAQKKEIQPYLETRLEAST